jgi:hypothetical protein
LGQRGLEQAQVAQAVGTARGLEHGPMKGELAPRERWG